MAPKVKRSLTLPAIDGTREKAEEAKERRSTRTISLSEERPVPSQKRAGEKRVARGSLRDLSRLTSDKFGDRKLYFRTDELTPECVKRYVMA